MALFDFLRENWPILLGPLLGLTAVCILLPRPKRGSVLAGAACGAAALLVAGFVIARSGATAGIEMTIEVFLFYVFAAAAVISGGLLVTQTNPARAALSFALVILATCGLFLLQAGPFLMVSTIIVYAGAIIVTFLFVIMLAQQQGVSDADARSREPFLASMTGFLLLCALLYILKLTYKPDLDRWADRTAVKLERIKDLQAKGNASPDEIKTLVADLRQFTQDYLRWLKNDWLSPKDPQNEDAKKAPPTPKRPPPQAEALAKAVEDAQALPDKDVNLALIEKNFEALLEVSLATRNDPLLGGLRPATDKLSELSGPGSWRPTVPPSEKLKETHPEQYREQLQKAIRRDAIGRPHLPAENSAYLGRSLFTDYLLSIELAGTLLLVATVGAIAIATRKSNTRFGSASANGSAPRRTA